MAVPLLLLNGGLYYFSIKKNPASRYAEFFFEVVAPICKNQTFVSAICIGIISGASEELFFRGALQAELQEHVAFPLAAVLTNILFSCGHFIGAMRRFARLILFYFLFGLYFSFLAEFLGSIWVPAIAHAVYNTIVIIGVGRLLRSS
jgi:membrane protease YdiL (CAAX protease family)